MLEFDKFIADEIAKYKDNYFPIKATLLERALVRKVNYKKLHPNPDDEFCMPSVGPSYRIINEYVQLMTEEKYDRTHSLDGKSITVEKMYPDGYMILNGHHRWAAYMRLGVKRVPINIVNLTKSKDILKMLNNSKYDKRVTINLDELGFGNTNSGSYEKSLPFPFSRHYKEQLRKGLPAICNQLSTYGYDIWVYTMNLYSKDYVRRLLKLYHIDTNFIVTGYTKFDTTDPREKKQLEELFVKKYDITIHIYGEQLLFVKRSENKSLGYPLKEDNWAGDILNILGDLHKNEE
ncbi:MAG: ParB/RepB/Spo0J family partition protein [Pseudobutyrivibrio sp.]|nr:ParB/RepB/Spo0J family partition protein [Pseudobutyrivibrio sp.]